ncbi:MAG: hypothetical protein F6K19_25290 [Cyanothece sp. SIO1E1]|nr:hypothetical protein [Cyanothece sp. SIO1E1]
MSCRDTQASLRVNSVGLAIASLYKELTVMYSKLIRWSGAASILGGICIALFWTTHPWGRLDGTEVALSPAWLISHNFHFLGACLILLGLVGLYARQMEKAGNLGLIAFMIALVGTAMFVGTGMLSAHLWPFIAIAAPDFVQANGPVFSLSPPRYVDLLVTGVLLIVGYVLMGIVTLRVGILPRMAAWLLIAGAVIFNLPPYPIFSDLNIAGLPVPWILIVVGSLVFGAAFIWLGYALWSSEDQVLGEN